MKTKFLLAAAMLFCMLSASFAQEAETVKVKEFEIEENEVVTASFWSNWFINAGVGGQLLYGDHENRLDFENRISPVFELSVGKWITPVIGARLGLSGLSLKAATQDGELSIDKTPIEDKPWHGFWLYNQDLDYFNLRGDFMVNLSNWICGYNAKRIWNVTPYIGFGWLRAYSHNTSSEISGHFGLINSFRLSDAFGLNIDVRGTLVNDDFDGERGGRQDEGILSASLGVTYNFKPRGWKQGTIVYYNEAELAALRDKLNDALAANERLKNQKNTEIIEKVTKVNTVAPCIVTFEINKSVLTNKARVTLGMFAEAIKEADSSVVYIITGYADEGTGNAELNANLSKARAEVVKDCLINEFGVSEKQLNIDYKGGVENMFYNDPRLSRSAIIRQAE